MAASVRRGAESAERKPRGSRGGRDDVWGKQLETSEPKVTQTSRLAATPTMEVHEEIQFSGSSLS